MFALLHAKTSLLLAIFLVSIPLEYETNLPPDGNGTMDSVAIWVAPNPHESLICFTDKTKNYVELHNPVTNEYVGRIGGGGSGAGELEYPNGVAVVYNVETGIGVRDVLFVVERDNARISAFSLPERRFIGHIGVGEVEEPYGIGRFWKDGKLQIWITDNEGSEDRVFVFDIFPAGEGLGGQLDFIFFTAGSLESIVIDPVWGRVYLSDESDTNNIMIYNLEGEFIERIGAGLFHLDPEGLALYDLGNGEGYLIASDQNASPTEFEVFDRKTNEWLGNFTGKTSGTDGVALTQKPLPNLPDGSFYAVDSDRTVHVYDWARIAGAMNLEINVDPAVSVKETIPPEGFRLAQNFPNPFNPSTKIRFSLPKSSEVKVIIYNLLGRTVRTLAKNRMPAGEHELVWDGRDAFGKQAASGVYIYEARLGDFVTQRKMILAR